MSTSGSDDDNKTGFVIGTGIEVKVAEHVSLGMEGLYYHFENEQVALFSGDDHVDDVDLDNDFAVVRARLSFHLNP